MTKQLLFQDTNLSEISFGNDGQSLTLRFLSMRDGHQEGVVVFHKLLILNYQTVTDQLPLYVGEVYLQELTGRDAELLLRQFGYGFTFAAGGSLPTQVTRLQVVHLEGGKIDIDIVSAEMKCYRPN